MNRKLNCLRCGSEMAFLHREKLQKGQHTWFMGDWNHLLAGALDVALFRCPGCGKLEFFDGTILDPKTEEEALARRKRCANCGYYDLDGPVCPVCGTRNNNY